MKVQAVESSLTSAHCVVKVWRVSTTHLMPLMWNFSHFTSSKAVIPETWGFSVFNIKRYLLYRCALMLLKDKSTKVLSKMLTEEIWWDEDETVSDWSLLCLRNSPGEAPPPTCPTSWHTWDCAVYLTAVDPLLIQRRIMIKYTKRFTGAGLDKPGSPHDQVRTELRPWRDVLCVIQCLKENPH